MQLRKASVRLFLKKITSEEKKRVCVCVCVCVCVYTIKVGTLCWNGSRAASIDGEVYLLRLPHYPSVPAV